MNYLLLGGPAHGEERALDNGETQLTVMAPSPGNPLPMPFKYTLREIEAETRPGYIFRRSVLIESSMPVDVATQALAGVLMQRFAEQLIIQFMEGGEQVNGNHEESQPSRTDNERLQRSADGSQHTASGIVIASR